MTAPHEYVPDGPVETAPLAGDCRPEIRREAFAAVLEGVHTGAYDERMVEWLVGRRSPAQAALMEREDAGPLVFQLTARPGGGQHQIVPGCARWSPR